MSDPAAMREGDECKTCRMRGVPSVLILAGYTKRRHLSVVVCPVCDGPIPRLGR